MINTLDLNCEILLNAKFNFKMLENKRFILKKSFESIVKSIDVFEKNIKIRTFENLKYKIPLKYDWDFISDQYLSVFFSISNKNL